MSNEQINHLRQLLCLPDTPASRSAVCAACLDDMMWDMAEATIPGLKVWADRQYEIAHALANNSSHFSMTDLKGADLRNAEMPCAILLASNMEGCDASGAYLFDAMMRECNLRSADLRCAVLISANLRSALVENADLRGAYLIGAYLAGAVLSGAKYNQHTQFPEGFDPVARGMVRSE